MIAEMKQAIAGVTAPERRETTIMSVWPSIASLPGGKLIGQLCGVKAGFGGAFNFGKPLALLCIPPGVLLYFARAFPLTCRRYVLTNHRVVVKRGIAGKDERWVDLDNFDAIEIETQPGYDWYRAGDLVFKNGQIETFRLPAVVSPGSFRATCLKARNAHVGVAKLRPKATAK